MFKASICDEVALENLLRTSIGIWMVLVLKNLVLIFTNNWSVYDQCTLTRLYKHIYVQAYKNISGSMQEPYPSLLQICLLVSLNSHPIYLKTKILKPCLLSVQVA